ncbi:MAG: CoA transferase, partial [Pseudomonadota bacterium]
MGTDLPLEGVRVLAIEQYGAGPFGTLFLADQGAELIKIENPNTGGDFARDVGPYFFTPENSEFFHAYNRNKKSLSLDLSKPEGREVFLDLVKDADAVASNLRGDVPAKLGLTYEALKDVNPKIVCAHLSAYGREGSRASWPGFDYLMQAEAGYFALTGEPETPPTRFGLSVVDQMTGLALAYALLAGLTGARATGVGRDMDVSLFDVAMCNTAYPAIWYLNEGHEQDRLPRSGHPALTPCQLYTTKDGWIFLMCNKEKFWPALCKAIGKDEWAEDPRFARFKDRLENRQLIQELLDEELSGKTTAEWLEIFAGNVPASPINGIAEAIDNPFLAEREGIQTLQLEGYGDYRMLASPVRSSGADVPANPAPALGEHTEELLTG